MQQHEGAEGEKNLTSFQTLPQFPHADARLLLEVEARNPEAYVEACRDFERRIAAHPAYCAGIGDEGLALHQLRRDLRKRRTEVERDLQRAIDTGNWDSWDFESDLTEVVDV